MAINKWAVLDRHLVTMEKPACVMSPHQKPQMKSLRVGRTSDHRLCVSSHRGAQPGLWIFSHVLRSAPAAARLDVSCVLEARTNRFGANPLGGNNLELVIALFPRRRLQDFCRSLASLQVGTVFAFSDASGSSQLSHLSC